MTRANRRITSAGLSLAVALTACGSRGNEAAVLQLHCRGDEVIDAQPPKRSVSRIYRFDLQASALENWNPQAGQFVRWGTGRMSIDKRYVAFAGEVRPMNENIRVIREVEFDRSTKKIRDHVEASWGSAAEFNGTCDDH